MNQDESPLQPPTMVVEFVAFRAVRDREGTEKPNVLRQSFFLRSLHQDVGSHETHAVSTTHHLQGIQIAAGSPFLRPWISLEIFFTQWS